MQEQLFLPSQHLCTKDAAKARPGQGEGSVGAGTLGALGVSSGLTGSWLGSFTFRKYLHLILMTEVELLFQSGDCTELPVQGTVLKLLSSLRMFPERSSLLNQFSLSSPASWGG